nr:uncharacterized protein LOC112004933 [Quercus suber]
MLESGKWAVNSHLGDKWLITPSTYKVIFPPRNFNDFPMVFSLIDQETKWWKTSVVSALFLPFESDTILKIPLSQNFPEDSLIWIGNKRGVFTIKSAYHIAANLLDDSDFGECSSGDPNAYLWKSLWKLKLPGKIKIFSWIACVDGLPVYVRMVERGIKADFDCPVCGEKLECLLHALVSCDFALSVWSLWQDCPLDLLLNAKDFTSLVHQLVHNVHSLSPLQVWEMAKNVVEDFQEANLAHLPLKQPSNSGWEAPPRGFFKINVDGASSLDGHRVSGVGVIIHDANGGLVAALSKAMPLHYPADWTELFAMEQGVLLARELAIQLAIFESDASSVIQVISLDLRGGEAGHLIQEI